MMQNSKIREIIKREKRRRALQHDTLCDCDFAHDNGENPRASRFAKNYADNFERFGAQGAGLFLYGASGAGKTFLAAAIINELTDRGYRCLYTSMLTIMNTLPTLSYETRCYYINQFSSVQLLVLDDFGIESETSYSNNILNGIVSTCFQKDIPIIAISPYPRDALLKESSDSKRNVAVKRLHERCLDYTVMMPAARRTENFRQKKKTEELLHDGVEPKQGTLPLDENGEKETTDTCRKK